MPLCALVAQLDRALDYESRGREFESSRARHFHSPQIREPWVITTIVKRSTLENRRTLTHAVLDTAAVTVGAPSLPSPRGSLRLIKKNA